MTGIARPPMKRIDGPAIVTVLRKFHQSGPFFLFHDAFVEEQFLTRVVPDFAFPIVYGEAHSRGKFVHFHKRAVKEFTGFDHCRLDLDDLNFLQSIEGRQCLRRHAGSQPNGERALSLGMEQHGNVAGHELAERIAVGTVDFTI
jgi:hypothetical protein